MIEKQLDIPIELPSSFVFKVIKMHYKGRYNTIVVSNKKLIIRKIHPYNYSNKAYAFKKLSFNDYGCFLLFNNKLRFKINLGKQILFWVSMVIVGMVLSVEVFNSSFLYAIIFTCMPIFLIWIIGLMSLNIFMTNELHEISRKLKVKRN